MPKMYSSGWASLSSQHARVRSSVQRLKQGCATSLLAPFLLRAVAQGHIAHRYALLHRHAAISHLLYSCQRLHAALRTHRDLPRGCGEGGGEMCIRRRHFSGSVEPHHAHSSSGGGSGRGSCRRPPLALPSSTLTIIKPPGASCCTSACGSSGAAATVVERHRRASNVARPRGLGSR